MLFGLFMAWETRKVKVAALNDSKQIGIFLFFNSPRLYLSVNTGRYLDIVLTFFECYGRQKDVKTTLCSYKNPVNTRRFLDVDSTLFECYGRQMDVRRTLR